MRKTTYEEFCEELRRTGGYATKPENKPARRAKPSALATLRFSLGVASVFPKCALYEPFNRFTIARWADFCFGAITAPESLGMSVTVEGFKNREAHKGPVVYLCNHLSTVETIMLPAILINYSPFSYVAKASLAHLPFLGKAAEHTGMIGLGRKSPREDLKLMLETGASRIKEGSSLLIFPQGTRQQVFSRKVYSSIGAKLAEKAGCPIVPLVVDTRCQPTREGGGLLAKVFKDFGPLDTAADIRCACGPVIPHGKAKTMHEAAFDWMAGKLESWGMPTERQAAE